MRARAGCGIAVLSIALLAGCGGDSLSSAKQEGNQFSTGAKFGWIVKERGASKDELIEVLRMANTKRLRTDDQPRGGSTQDALVGGDS